MRDQLKYSWAPFFAKFGRLTNVQKLSIPVVLSGQSTFVCAPTASGKTEAVVAPLAEIAVTNRFDGLHTVYVVPTRALANDILYRIQGPLAEMGIETAIKHGDTHLSELSSPNVLITTPESIDSLLCRRPELFDNLRTIVLDEIHLIDSTPRGDQARILLNRLKRHRNSHELLVHLISATVSDPAGVASRYSPGATIVKLDGRRMIQLEVCSSDEELIQFAKRNLRKKILYFCNYRSSVERAAERLASLWDPYPVVAHHGRKTRQERLDAEQIMKESHVSICVATSTLEIGIDVGDIDTVVLGEIPWSVSSLAQRVGRSNRRGTSINAVGIIAPGETDKLEILQSMVQAANDGILESVEYQADKSVGIQQIYSMLFAHPEGVEEKSIQEILLPLCNPDETDRIVEHLIERGLVDQRAGLLMASSHIMDLGVQGHVHTNISDNTTYDVIDLARMEVIGKVHDIVDKVFFLDGKLWEADRIENNKVMVSSYVGTLSPSLFRPCRYQSAFRNLLPPDINNFASG